MERNEADGASCDSSGSGNVRGHLTPYDRQSIMIWSYCDVERQETDLLSAMDRLGVEMMYPKATSGHKLACGDGCVQTGDGVVVRTDGSLTIDWVSRGADVDPVWRVGLFTTIQTSDGRLPASRLPATTNNITMTFPDAFGNPNFNLYLPTSQQHAKLSGGGTAVKSDAIHAAIILASAAS
jgi:hypothetical protein